MRQLMDQEAANKNQKAANRSEFSPSPDVYN
jgi:hypothetical protein